MFLMEKTLCFTFKILKKKLYMNLLTFDYFLVTCLLCPVHFSCECFSLQKKERMELDDDERTARFIEKQMQRVAATTTQSAPTAQATELQREGEEKITLSLGMGVKKKEDKAL
jgi:hypothetical protein